MSNGDISQGGTEGCGKVLQEYNRWNGDIWEVRGSGHSGQKVQRWGTQGFQEGQSHTVLSIIEAQALGQGWIRGVSTQHSPQETMPGALDQALGSQTGQAQALLSKAFSVSRKIQIQKRLIQHTRKASPSTPTKGATGAQTDACAEMQISPPGGKGSDLEGGRICKQR